MHVVFPGKDLVEDVVGQHLVVLDHAPHLQLLNAVGNVEDLRFLVPDEPVDAEGQNFLGQNPSSGSSASNNDPQVSPDSYANEPDYTSDFGGDSFGDDSFDL